jgi:hypothetical protein
MNEERYDESLLVNRQEAMLPSDPSLKWWGNLIGYVESGW